MQYLINLISRYGLSRTAAKLNIPSRLVSSISRGVSRATTGQLASFRNVYRSVTYTRLKAAGFSADIARAFRDLSMTGAQSRIDYMNKLVNDILERRLAGRLTPPSDPDKWIRETRAAIRKNLQMTDKTWEELQYQAGF